MASTGHPSRNGCAATRTQTRRAVPLPPRPVPSSAQHHDADGCSPRCGQRRRGAAPRPPPPRHARCVRRSRFLARVVSDACAAPAPCAAFGCVSPRAAGPPPWASGCGSGARPASPHCRAAPSGRTLRGRSSCRWPPRWRSRRRDRPPGVRIRDDARARWPPAPHRCRARARLLRPRAPPPLVRPRTRRPLRSGPHDGCHRPLRARWPGAGSPRPALSCNGPRHRAPPRSSHPTPRAARREATAVCCPHFRQAQRKAYE